MEGKSMAHVAVLGAGGTIAPAIVRDLAESEKVGELVLLDLDGARAAEVAAQHAPGRATARAVDAREGDALARALEGVDVLVNSGSYRINLEAMQACLDAGAHYLDLGGLYWMTQRQLEFGDAFERAGLVAILGIGSSPGKTNLMAAHAVAQLGGPGTAIESIEVMAAGRDQGAPNDGRLHPPYAIQTLVDELTLEPIVIREGQPEPVKPLSDGGEVDYGEPIGRAQTIFTLHSEMATFPDSFGCRGGSFRLSLAGPLLERLKELVGASAEEVAAASREAAPQSSQTVSVHLIHARAHDGRACRVRAVTRSHFGLGGGIISTATPAAAAVRLLARGSITARGAHPPERCIDPEEMFDELRARGCTFSLES
ncbi:MAG TPA: saccharopine dehydrogenase NADP-binding domain-containing protein [Solirubrobacteraceae bacterium]|jgi:saccharopine dehydrogenase (NAD+, L-lysine-forming)